MLIADHTTDVVKKVERKANRGDHMVWIAGEPPERVIVGSKPAWAPQFCEYLSIFRVEMPKIIPCQKRNKQQTKFKYMFLHDTR